MVLLEILQLFGEGIHESLGRTMGDYLKATNGPKANDNISQLDRDRTSELRGTNNDAERPCEKLCEGKAAEKEAIPKRPRGRQGRANIFQ